MLVVKNAGIAGKPLSLLATMASEKFLPKKAERGGTFRLSQISEGSADRWFIVWRRRRNAYCKSQKQ